MQKKSDMLDSLWKFVGADTAKHLPELRKELMSNNDIPYFYFDGSSLLLSLSNKPGDLKIAFEAIKMCDLADLQGGPYVEMLHMFAANGYNTADYALKIIDSKKFSAYFPMHVMTLDKNLSLVFSLLALDNNLYMSKIIRKIKELSDTNDIHQVLDFLNYVCTCQADSVILAFANDPKQPASIRKYAKEDVMPDSIKRENKPSEYNKLIAERRKNLTNRGVSDEALGDIIRETIEIKKYYTCSSK